MFSEHSLSVFCVSSNSLSTRQEEKLNLNVKIELYLTFILLIGSFSCFLMQNFLFWFFAENINISYCLQVNISSVRWSVGSKNDTMTSHVSAGWGFKTARRVAVWRWKLPLRQISEGGETDGGHEVRRGETWRICLTHCWKVERWMELDEEEATLSGWFSPHSRKWEQGSEIMTEWRGDQVNWEEETSLKQ